MTITKKRIKVFAPASIANVGPGFDVLGVAIHEPGDIVIAERQAEPVITFSLHNAETDLPPCGANVAAHVARLMLDELNLPFGIKMVLHKSMPVGSGLGSSGASSAASVFAVSQLLDTPLDKHALISFAMEGERLATGSAHADNVAPSLLGGVCLIRDYHPLDVIQLPHTNKFHWAVIHPQIIIHTKTARELLPDHIPLSTAIQQMGNLSALVTGLSQGDEMLVAKSMHDVIAEPLRSQLIPGYEDARKAALGAGAIGFSLSGSGPSVFAITLTRNAAEKVSEKVSAVFKLHANVDSDIYISQINEKGAYVLDDTE